MTISLVTVPKPSPRSLNLPFSNLGFINQILFVPNRVLITMKLSKPFAGGASRLSAEALCEGGSSRAVHGGTICGPTFGSCGTEGSFAAGLGLICDEVPVDVL